MNALDYSPAEQMLSRSYEGFLLENILKSLIAPASTKTIH